MLTFPEIQLELLAPEIIMALGATLLLLTEPWASRKNSSLPCWLGIGIAVLAAVAMRWSMGVREDVGADMVAVDGLTQFFRGLVLGVTILVLLMSPDYAKRFKIQSGEFYALILFAGFGAMLMAGAEDLIVLFLGLEVHSISLYVLAGSRRTSLISEESALKYLLLGAFASAFLLYGIALLYGATRTTNLYDIAVVLRTGDGGGVMLFAGVGLLIVGLGFKIAAVPFHMWTPDVYEGAPTVITALMTVVPKAGAFAALLRIFLIGLLPAMPTWQPVWIILAVLTMTVGNVLALNQEGLKRLLAYSSIAHAGYLLVGFVSGSELGGTSVLYYLVAYALMNLGAFAVVVIFEGERQGLTIRDYAGLAAQRPILGAALALFLFSLAGIPPTAGFMGKLYLFKAAIESGHTGLAIIALLNSVLAAYYYLRVVVVAYMGTPESDWTRAARAGVGPAVVILAAAIGTLQFGIFPSMLYELARSSVAALGL